jgi:hypothetical protein
LKADTEGDIKARATIEVVEPRVLSHEWAKSPIEAKGKLVPDLKKLKERLSCFPGQAPLALM